MSFANNPELIVAMVSYINLGVRVPKSSMDLNYSTLLPHQRTIVKRMLAKLWSKRLVRMNVDMVWELLCSEAQAYRKALHMPYYVETVYTQGKQICCSTLLDDDDTVVKKLFE